MSTPNKLVWFHSCHGLLGVFDTVEQLYINLDSQPYPKPDFKKIVAELSPVNPFHYGLGLLHIQMVKVHEDVEDVIHAIQIQPEPSLKQLRF